MIKLCGVGVPEQWNKFKTQSSSKYFRKGPLPLIHVKLYSETILPCLLPTQGLPQRYLCPSGVSANMQLSLLGSEKTAAPPCRQLWLRQTGLSSASGTSGSQPDSGVSWGAREGWGKTAWGWKMNGFISLMGEEGDGLRDLQNITSWQKYFEKQEIPGKQ